MEIVPKKFYKEAEIKTYIAFDGKEFLEMSDCLAYEEEQTDKLLDESPDVIVNKEAEEHMPFNGEEYYENHTYKWVKPLNEKGVELLNQLFRNSFDSVSCNDDIAKWVCLEISDDDVYTSHLENSLEYAKNMCRIFGVDIGGSPASDTVVEMCPNCSREVEMRWNTKEDGYEAFCPYCGKKLMLCDECQHREDGGEFTNDCDHDSKTGDCRFKDNEYEYILDFANSGTFDYEDNTELKTLRVLWTAYCLHKNYDVDTASYDSVLSEIFDRLGDVTPEFMEKGFEKFDRYMCKYLV